MIPLSEVRVLDRNAAALGVPTSQLMENAGRAVAEEALRLGEGPVLVLCGPGNNGGDGVVAARHIARQRRVTVALAVPRREVKSSLLEENLGRLVGIRLVEAPDEAVLEDLVQKSGIVVDALLGAGLQGRLREPYRTWARVLNERMRPVLSVDVPTGLGTDAAVRPAVTVALHDTKEGMSEASCGRIVVRDVGIPPRAASHTGPGELLLYPIPKPTQHKGQGGVVLVLGGGPYTGAPALTAMAALRAGADLAIVLTPHRAAPAIAGYSPDLIVRGLDGPDLDLTHPDNLQVLEEFLPRATAVCLGNGMGRSDRALASVGSVLDRLGRAALPVVVDADAIHAVGRDRPPLRRGIVLTPHAGEFQALTGEALHPEEEQDKRAAQAREWARRLGCTLVVKGHASVITDGERLKLNGSGNPGMSHGGTGDVLAGALGALLGKRLDPFDAARVAAWLCGRAGDLAFEELRFGMMASDLLARIPAVFREQGLHWREETR